MGCYQARPCLCSRHHHGSVIHTTHSDACIPPSMALHGSQESSSPNIPAGWNCYWVLEFRLSGIEFVLRVQEGFNKATLRRCVILIARECFQRMFQAERARKRKAEPPTASQSKPVHVSITGRIIYYFLNAVNSYRLCSANSNCKFYESLKFKNLSLFFRPQLGIKKFYSFWSYFINPR